MHNLITLEVAEKMGANNTGKNKIFNRGIFHLEFYREGRLLRELEFENLFVNAGKTLIATALAGSTVNIPSRLAIGASATPPREDQTGLLGTELARVALDSRVPEDANAKFGYSADTGSTTSQLVCDQLTEGTQNYWKYATVTMTSGANNGLTREVLSFTPAVVSPPAPPVLVFTSAFPNAIAINDTFDIRLPAKVKNTATIPAGVGTGTIEEIAIFTTDTTPVMLCRSCPGPQAKGISDTLIVTYYELYGV